MDSLRRNGTLQVRYDTFTESFKIRDGRKTAEEVDEQMGFSFILPRCMVLLHEMSRGRRAFILSKGGSIPPVIPTDSTGSFHNLHTRFAHWISLEPQDEERRRQLHAIRAQWDLECIENLKAACFCHRGTPCDNPESCVGVWISPKKTVVTMNKKR